MIATHNIKVDGKWYYAGEEYELPKPETPKAVEKPAEEPAPVVEEPVKEEAPKAEPKARSTSRRKKVSE